jgi:glycosyl transferase, family 25
MNYIDKIMYINLDRRIDRKEQIEGELSKFDLPYERFSAIPHKIGAVGCSKSHLEILKTARNKGYKNILIFEDDFEFLVSRDIFLNNIKEFFESNIQFDVLMLAHCIVEAEFHNNLVDRAIKVHTTAGYIVNEGHYTTIINSLEHYTPLLEETNHHWLYSCDVIWHECQRNGNYYILKPTIGKQRPSYSDISECYKS